MTEPELRDLLVELGASLFARGYSVGSAGNISVRLPDGYLMTPTNSCLGRLKAERISKLDPDWRHVGGDKPSKEVFMHRAVLTARPEAGAVVHLHSTYATAIGCLAGPEDTAPIPPLTPYFVMRVGRVLPVIRYSVDWWGGLHQRQSINVFGESAISSAMIAPLWWMVIGTKFWFAGSVLAKARADNLDREAGKAWVGGRVDAARATREAQP